MFERQLKDTGNISEIQEAALETQSASLKFVQDNELISKIFFLMGFHIFGRLNEKFLTA